MGCPVPKIVGNGSGSALMKDIPRAVEIAKETVKNAGCPVTVKFRAGWDDTSRNAVEFAKALEQTGIAAMAVHGRTRQQFYSGEADWEIIKQVKQAVSIPVFGNGDVKDGESCKKMYEETGCDLVMLARGSYGRPWVFREIRHFLETGEKLPEPDIKERMEIMLKHCRYLCKYKGEVRGMKEARKNVAWYVKGLPDSAKLRAECGELSAYEQAEDMAARIISREEQCK
jgi:tRNA-dihydrouridine synthase B